MPPTVLVVLAAAGVAIAAEASRNRPLNSEAVGPQSDGSYLTPVNQFLTPAGSTIRYDAGRLQDTGISPDGRTAVSLAWHHFSGSFAVFDLIHQRLLQQYTPPSGTGSGDVSFRGVLWSRDGRTVWVAQSGNLLRFPVSSNRTLGTPTVVALPAVAGRSAIPAGLTWARRAATSSWSRSTR